MTISSGGGSRLLSIAGGNENTVGHRGLFFYPTAPGGALDPATPGLYYHRNRWYSPQLGRLLQRDPLKTAIPLGLGAAAGEEVKGGGIPPSVIEDVIESGVEVERRIVNGVERIAQMINNVKVISVMKVSN